MTSIGTATTASIARLIDTSIPRQQSCATGRAEGFAPIRDPAGALRGAATDGRAVTLGANGTVRTGFEIWVFMAASGRRGSVGCGRGGGLIANDHLRALGHFVGPTCLCSGTGK